LQQVDAGIEVIVEMPAAFAVELRAHSGILYSPTCRARSAAVPWSYLDHHLVLDDGWHIMLLWLHVAVE
jgi:hypothetical protein